MSQVHPGRWCAELRTGRLRPSPVGSQAEVSEVVVKTRTDDGASYPPHAAVRTRTTLDEDWSSVLQKGSLSLEGTESEGQVTGNGTLLSHVIATWGESGTGPFSVNVSPRKCRVFQDEEELTGWTYDGFEITLASAKPSFSKLRIVWAGAPQQVGRAGDVVRLADDEDERCGVITVVSDHENAGSDWGPVDDSGECVLIPAVSVGHGETETVLGCPREVDDLEVQVLLVPRVAGDVVTTKLKELVVVGFSTGEERTGDAEQAAEGGGGGP